MNDRQSAGAVGNVLVRYPLPVLLAFMLIAVALGWQARNFELDASADTLLTRDNELYIESLKTGTRFEPQEFILVGYKPRNHELLSQKTFDDLRALSRDIRKLERVTAVRSLLNVPLIDLAKSPLVAMGNVENLTLEKQGYSPGELSRVLRGHPVYEDLLINREQTATALQVLFREDPELASINDQITRLKIKKHDQGLAPEEASKLRELEASATPLDKELTEQRNREIEAIRSMVVKYEDDAHIYLGGVHVLGYQLIDIIRNDLYVFGAAIAVMICIVLLAIFRRLRWVLIPVICCAVSVVSTMGLLAFAGLKATVISANFIALQLILTLAIVVHLIVEYRELRAANEDAAQDELVVKTLKRKFAPCLFSGLTTSVGFAALLFSGIQPVISFGWMMIIAMCVSIIVSLVLFPSLMAFTSRERSIKRSAWSERAMQVCAEVSLGKRAAILAGTLLIVALGAVGSLKISVENSFLNYFDEDTRVHRELAFIDRELGGSTPMDITYKLPPAQHPDFVVLTEETSTRLQKIQRHIESHEATGKVLSVVNFTELAKRVNDGDPLAEFEMTMIYKLMGEKTRDDLMGSVFDEDAHQYRFSVRVQDTTPGLDRERYLQDLRNGIESLGVGADDYKITGLFVLYQDILSRLFDSQVKTLGFVLVAMFAMFVILFRSVRYGLVAIVPNLVSTVVLFGTMGWLGIPLDLMTITIAAIAMGIAVDDTIHYLHRYREERAAGDAVAAVKASHNSVGYALLYTTLIILLGFSLFAFSDFAPSVVFGLLTAMAMVVALASDLLVLPMLLQRFAPDT